MFFLRLGISSVLLFASVFAQERADDILKKVQDKFSSIKSFSADFYESQSSAEGVFYFKKENQFKILTSKQEITNNGSTIWNYDLKLNRVVINDVENEQSSFSLRQYLFDYPKKCNVNILDTNSVEKALQFIPRSDELGFSSAKIYIDEDNLVKKIELNNNLDSGIKFEFKNINLDVDLSADFFNFNPPKGSRIIDLR
jgi:outer membrane lipoprotein-sorting protein